MVIVLPATPPNISKLCCEGQVRVALPFRPMLAKAESSVESNSNLMFESGWKPLRQHVFCFAPGTQPALCPTCSVPHGKGWPPVPILNYYKRKALRCIDSRPDSWHIRNDTFTGATGE